MAFSDKLIAWYLDNARQLPWRSTDNPYYIWLSEIILQQTRIEQGLQYYHHFVTSYPTVFDLAAAPEERVLKSWQGLGYYSRARNLHAAARYIVENLGGRFPDTYEEILKLKWVGRYTAAAIASFAFRLPYPVIDGNVYRFVSRLYGIDTPIGTDAAYNEFESLLSKLIDRHRPDLFNQALMDFGSIYCHPVSAKGSSVLSLDNCDQCVFRQQCVAFLQGKVALLPVRRAPIPVKTRYFYYFDIRWQMGERRYAFVRQRLDDDIWKGLFEYPLLESESPLDERQLRDRSALFLKGFSSDRPRSLSFSRPMVHKLTHRTIVARFVGVDFGTTVLSPHEGLLQVEVDRLKSFPVSRLMDRYLSAK